MAGSMSGTRTGHDSTGGRKVGATGWTVFAAVMMIFGGAMAVLEGIAAIAKDDLFVSTRNYVFEFSLTGWGWVHLILGIVVVLMRLRAVHRGVLGPRRRRPARGPAGDRQLPVAPVLPVLVDRPHRDQYLRHLGAVLAAEGRSSLSTWT